MKTWITTLAAATLGVAATFTIAQPARGPGAGAGPGPMAAAPGASMPGMGMGPGAGMGRHARTGADSTPGWAMMTEQERNEHRTRMQAMTSHEECTAYMAQHHEQMAARAKERGGKALGQPRRDACAPLKK